VTYPPTPRTTPTRLRDTTTYDRAAAHAILDEAYDCTVAHVVDGAPRALPTLHVRVDDTLYLHASTGSRLGLAARGAGLPVCVSVTLLDGLVYGRSQFHHSANYRSVVAHGVATLVTEEAERRTAMTALVEKAAPGRSTASRAPSRRELGQTAVLALPLREVSVRTRTGGVRDDPADLALPHWAGVVPVRRVFGVPRSDAGVTVPVPPALRPARSPWHGAPTLVGERVTLEALDVSHVDGLYAAVAHENVWAHLTAPLPRSRSDLAAYVEAALEDPDRVAYAIRDTAAGDVIGTTSFYGITPKHRGIAIGHTILAPPHWGTGANAAAKLLLLSRAFDELGAERVELHTDIRNRRSQRAIERLGATREAVLRRHRLRVDGTWRDTVLYAITAESWPQVAVELRRRPAGRENPAAAELRRRPATGSRSVADR
jgi:RimJ/RimL family protein N-acetyltransferase/nitroimidazol reductase NimA-like FMN-containing flavoprotein (pyridoxamine 5'-phosphate oxidase superfamily)